MSRSQLIIVFYLLGLMTGLIISYLYILTLIHQPMRQLRHAHSVINNTESDYNDRHVYGDKVSDKDEKRLSYNETAQHYGKK